ncbi:cysteine desulfurase [Candidatus Nitrosopelagicus brevis]|uniref:Aminotransferase, class V n=1 Tax=Candidatus Nitrosopelagicus brevis TaxID=1410606 RepID=A0A0A7V1K1_9ARCH|nr:aminotransferase class V-fold PLP-dependent enzyme [Candidatus Nitrosopelagicus brevis]AJA92051.1 aminotransferase, class V [Candidatus Nitrosopelagicus brevis]PTL87261.1 cysteine desulfurase [Candidatus Nitrosopelagicus brevis]
MNFDSISEEFQTDKTYLNNASVSVMPKTSIEAMKQFLIDYSEMGPDSPESEIFIKGLWEKTRTSIAKVVKCNPDEIIITQSVTDGINIVANGMKFENDSNIVIRGGEHEHHANYFPWLKLGGKIDVRSLPVNENGGFGNSDLKKVLDEKTKLVALSHGLYNSGLILPVKEIGKELQKENVPYFLDTAQTVGCIGEFDFADTGCDFMSFNGSKWLCGPMGTGVFYCKRESSDLLEPSNIGGETAETNENGELTYKELPDRFQAGFRNYVGLAGMESSVTFLENLGWNNIRNHIISLSNLFIDEIGKISESRVFCPEDESERTSIVSFEIEKQDPEKIVSELAQKGIIIAKREIYEKPVLRISPHIYNTKDEILNLTEELKKL